MSGKAARKRAKQAAQLARLSTGDPNAQITHADADGAIVQFRRQSLHIGPLPAPDTMREYGEILPDGPERIFGMWERQAAHRQKLENRASWTETLMRPLALLSALGLAGGAGYVGWDLLKDGQDLAGFVSLVTAIGTLAAIFITGRKTPPQP